VLAVYTGPSVDTLSLVVCDDDAFGSAQQSRVTLFPAPGRDVLDPGRLLE
jgi:hypothetical protein